jgi:NTP pyrophosphatase (non-canonical NTP hydrolase)
MKRPNDKSVYLAGPITGLNYAGCSTWREAVAKQLKDVGIDAYSPMRAKAYLASLAVLSGHGTEYKDMGVLSTARGVMTRDRFDATRCGVLFVNLLGATQVSTGTVMEIAWADLVPHADRVRHGEDRQPARAHDGERGHRLPRRHARGSGRDHEEHPPVNLKETARTHWAWVDEMGWHRSTVLEKLALIASEVGEAVNECRKGPPSPAFGAELADIVLRVLDTAECFGVDIEAEIAAKMAANRERGSRGRTV